MDNNMNVMDIYMSYWKNFINMNGRTRRRNYWIPVIITLVIEFIIGIIGGFFDLVVGNHFGEEGGIGDNLGDLMEFNQFDTELHFDCTSITRFKL
ncbi:hypothetical protein BFS35_004205 [Macrococcoides goetzii]|uniref:DUF805 domain-containing protein n=1 Tax=Macrococcoides goetzii TaxID=1891097 RepID=A0A2G5NTY4_9STAP|nr:hypothetical protein [Macrococcus goetzii]RAI82895.1 hypothetical protein BFS35_004205 [Macrococcus goetzii]